jgi:hypothetical protein
MYVKKSGPKGGFIFFMTSTFTKSKRNEINESCLLPHNKERNKIKSIFNFVVEKNNANAKNNKEERMKKKGC